jgi:hypothetical protein
MNSIGGNRAEVFGLYELSDDGTILYSRARAGNQLREPSDDIVGRDFFGDIVQFQNANDLRGHFRRFIAGSRPADTFLFDCRYGSEVVKTKIFLTRAYETDNDRVGGIVIMDIREIGDS